MTLIEAGFIFAAVSMFIFAGLLIGKATDPQRLPVRHSNLHQDTLRQNTSHAE